MNNNEVKLKPCPFCGGRAYFAFWGNYETIYIDCEHTKDCGNNVNGWFNAHNFMANQVKEWNNRYEDKKPIKILGKRTNLWKGE